MLRSSYALLTDLSAILRRWRYRADTHTHHIDEPRSMEQVDHGQRYFGFLGREGVPPQTRKATRKHAVETCA